MKAFRRLRSIPTPFPRDNIDTDIIIPAEYLKTVSREGLGKGAFETIRRRADGTLRKDQPFDDPRWRGSEILAVGANFGCGSSREHAAWALADLGYRVVIGESFADIFASNAFKNGILTVTLAKEEMQAVIEAGTALDEIEVDLEAGEIRLADGRTFAFETDPFRRRCLLEGLDEVGLTLSRHAAAIDAYETKRCRSAPWMG
ncbi:MAG: 3-isopropylmalate dehydratase small subunit [Rhodothalassiaceae bacterium]